MLRHCGTILLSLLLVTMLAEREPPGMPTESPNTSPSSEQRLRGRVTDIILAGAKDIDTRSGGKIRKVDAIKAWRMAPLFMEAAWSPDAPMHFLAYLLATTTQESRNDPEARNPNYTNGSDPRRVDWGIGQLNGVNLLAAGHDPGKALDPEWAIPQVARIVRGNLKWAQDRFANSDPHYVAAMAYNKGRRGTVSILTRKPLPDESWPAFLKRAAAGRAHARGVMAWYRKFNVMLEGGKRI